MNELTQKVKDEDAKLVVSELQEKLRTLQKSMGFRTSSKGTIGKIADNISIAKQNMEKMDRASVLSGNDPHLAEPFKSVIDALTAEVQRLESKHEFTVELNSDGKGGFLVSPNEAFNQPTDQPAVTRLSHARSDARDRIKNIVNVLNEVKQLAETPDVDSASEMLKKLTSLQTSMESRTDSKKVIDNIVIDVKSMRQGGEQKQAKVAQAVKDPNLLDEQAKNAIIKLLVADAARLSSTYEKTQQKNTWEDEEDEKKSEVMKSKPEPQSKYDISKRRIEAINTFVQTLQKDDGTLSKQEVVSQLKDLQGKMESTVTKGLFSGKSVNVTSVKMIGKAITLAGENKGPLARLRGK